VNLELCLFYLNNISREFVFKYIFTNIDISDILDFLLYIYSSPFVPLLYNHRTTLSQRLASFKFYI
jgi:hypothetical protein